MLKRLQEEAYAYVNVSLLYSVLYIGLVIIFAHILGNDESPICRFCKMPIRRAATQVTASADVLFRGVLLFAFDLTW